MPDYMTTYEKITDVIHAALSNTSDPNIIKSLMAEYDAATAAYNAALNGSIVASSATTTALTQQLQAATNDIDAADKSAEGITNLLDKISIAVGVLAKIGSLVQV